MNNLWYFPRKPMEAWFPDNAIIPRERATQCARCTMLANLHDPNECSAPASKLLPVNVVEAFCFERKMLLRSRARRQPSNNILWKLHPTPPSQYGK